MANEFEVKFSLQGNVWTASLRDPSGDEAKTTAGFGETPEEALKDMFLERDKDDYQKKTHQQ